MNMVLANNIEKMSLPSMKDVQKMLAPFQHSNTRKAILQLGESLAGYVGLWTLMIFLVNRYFWLTIPLIILAAGFMIRLFIIFHDCGHNSFFSSREANRKIGFWLGVIVFTPSEQWWHSHAIHHATSGNLDKRGIGDVQTLTVAEYQALSPMKKLGYRLFRNPLIMFLVGPLFMFLVTHRLPIPVFGKKETISIVVTDLIIAGIAVILGLTIGWLQYIFLQISILFFAGLIGIWLFYIQHQFEDVYWARGADWNYLAAALRGASYYKLPGILQWFTGNIGFHTIHHLSPRIPNYLLPACFEANPLLQQQSRVIGFWESFHSLGLSLWDEQARKMVRFNILSKRSSVP
jgi:acyl-lipid omega-6 desaturase (Delta-12 desaturase)